MKSGGSAVSWVVVLMAASSLFLMVSLLQVDKIIQNDLYGYGLRFSYQWATQYWTVTSIAFGLCWFNIVAAIVVQLYTVTFRRKEVEQLVTEVEKEVSKMGTMPAEKVEEQKGPESKPTETAEQPTDTSPVSTMETETQEEEVSQTVTENVLGQGQTESEEFEEVVEQREQESETPAESETEQEEPTETRLESPEESEETPIKETQQQAAPDVS